MLTASGIWSILAVALVLDAVFGEPKWLWDRVPHPVVLLGRLIGWADDTLNNQERSRKERRERGLLFAGTFTVLAFVLGNIAQGLLLSLPLGWLVVAIIAAILIAQRSLYDHVRAVAIGLETGGLEGGRSAVSKIVGRDPETLNRSGVSRAAIESTAENFSDGVVAPAFWFALLGLGGIVAYKAINTADSMIGHRTERHEDFGAASAILDDVVNLIPARLSGVLIALAAPICGASFAQAFATMRADAGKHKSPNAGWPEAAMAGALDVALAGPRIYSGRTTPDPFLNEEGKRELGPRDIRRALQIIIWAAIIQLKIVAILAL